LQKFATSPSGHSRWISYVLGMSASPHCREPTCCAKNRP
jgi:hypothetical protein